VSTPLQVTFIWHMHQPWYREPLTGRYELPWTYLHAVKDYYDMAAIVEQVPGAKVVFNLVPSLLEQIEDYAAGVAVDPFLLHGRMHPATMGDEQRRFVLDNFFSANRERMIEPHKRYLELLYLAGNGSKAAAAERLRNFGEQELRDLQVWFFLAWTGEAARRRWPELAALVAKGRNFSEEDKEQLFACHTALLREIIPLYRRLQEQGAVELSVSPYFHPILPLLCDQSVARVAMPRVTLPQLGFRHEEDARAQISRGMEYFAERFGSAPIGMWPSEGSVSDAALTLMAACGIRWAATDEEVLAASLPDGLGPAKRHLYQPYVFAGKDAAVQLLFRDHQLSDLIGFTYSRWDAERAADDFVARLQAIAADPTGNSLVTIILDGENAWEYYRDNGYPFLKALYRKIVANPKLQLTTPAELLPDAGERRVLRHVHSGSWINANYGIWIGHPEENLAWDQLAQARAAAVAHSPAVAAMLAGTAAVDAATPAGQVCRALYAAEGSDWFWWYGDDHFSAHSDRFDGLFRANLMHVYRLLDLAVPRQLFEPIKTSTPAGLVRQPSTFITPTVNGVVDDYFEWLGAGLYDLSRQSSAMHAAESLLHCFFYGYDAASFYVRLDGAAPLETLVQPGDQLRLHLVSEREYLLVMAPESGAGELLVKDASIWCGSGQDCHWRIGRVCELRIPLSALALEQDSRLFAYITLTREQEEIGRWPTHTPLALRYRGTGLLLENWLV
jgi:alpha-amylase/alpha-mannosidase (GH57 family)